MPVEARPVPKAFNPAGWDAVKTEAIRKEQKLSRTSSDVLYGIHDKHGGSPPAGWAWFTNAGFCDAFDREKAVRRRFTQQPTWERTPPAGHDSVEQKMRQHRERFSSLGREAFLDRTDASRLLGPMALTQGWSQAANSPPQSWPGSPASASRSVTPQFNRSHRAAGVHMPHRHLSAVALRIPGHAEVF
mmetsp:Transcript_22012/g.39451  ORF Transcript_22012/g.39451 Transcript_22012/m.39451 type:complete len:188 (+) Transcript_22012:97-660(+)|eukprot:CAMPEP_0197656282 /NCGR_PEP_ID=MMETSP1338-20131121/41155_1 /TAXON_ID=43686 ORGANISM="Pelagodinium beii, Strain RCC1491" /NCGR_SAMPLE_ID=MMETSP1338 /ASSEMBLY_ACC=CAM_ASM_000754 /LENGTH=187 /DNA_ID=CAMNT_0043232211 /DNA_START=90 /DNA_END=653 /DNA_ORIENTATION=+